MLGVSSAQAEREMLYVSVKEMFLQQWKMWAPINPILHKKEVQKSGMRNMSKEAPRKKDLQVEKHKSDVTCHDSNKNERLFPLRQFAEGPPISVAVSSRHGWSGMLVV